MQLLPQRPPHLPPQDVDEILFRGLFHAGDAAEALDEEASALLADAGEVVELTVQRALGAAPTVGGDGETVRFIAHHLQELQGGIALLQADRLLAVGNVDLLFTLRQAGNGDLFDAEAIEGGQCGIELPAPAVDEDHVGERLPLLHQAAVAAVHRLGHGAEVVRADDALDVEDAVLVLVELPAVEDHHPGHRVGALDVRDVERLDLLDLPVVPESLPKFLCSDLHPVLLRLAEARLVRQLCIAVGQLHPVDAFAALRRANRDLPLPLLPQPFREQLPLFDLHRDEDLGRNEEIVLVVALQHLAEEVAGLVLADLFPEQLAAVDDVTVADDEELHGDVASILVHAPDVDFLVLRRRHLLLRLDPLPRPDQGGVIRLPPAVLPLRPGVPPARRPVLQLL